jgi:hypothetical protein
MYLQYIQKSQEKQKQNKKTQCSVLISLTSGAGNRYGLNGAIFVVFLPLLQLPKMPYKTLIQFVLWHFIGHQTLEKKKFFVVPCRFIPKTSIDNQIALKKKAQNFVHGR